MNAIIITRAGSEAAGFDSYRYNGYKVIPVPRIIDLSMLTNTDKDVVAFNQLDVDMGKENLDRATLIRLLEDDSLAGTDTVISSYDACTRVHAKLLAKHISSLIEEHNEVDVISLISDYTKEYDDTDFLDHKTQVSFSPKTPQPAATTYALVIPSCKRHKVAKLLAETELCVADCIHYGSVTGKLSVYCPSENFAWRKQTVSRAKVKMLSLLMMSYKRPKELVRQILSMFGQTYSNFKMYVAVKGITEPDFTTIVVPQVYKYIQDGRLHIQYYPNKNQLSNFIDCIRYADLDKNSLCVKIDDDDIYHPKFLEHLMSFHASLPEDAGSYYDGDVWAVFKHGTINSIRRHKRQWSLGNCIAFPASIFSSLVDIEKHPQAINERYYPRAGFREDSIIHDINVDMGAVDRTKFYDMAGFGNDVILDLSATASVTRNADTWYLSEEFMSANKYINTEPSNYEYTLALYDNTFGDAVAVVFATDIVLPGRMEHGSIVFHDPGIKVGVRWDNGREEVYVRNDNGVFSAGLLA